MGPEDEDPEYAAGCAKLVQQLGARIVDRISRRVPDVLNYFLPIDVLALST